ncbi:hypothetical protein BJ322DRAFT_1026234 [Thelephora terrestris]|uniref:Uncharacterized protein n=1 Tax=Thelephora terrestris TaxID=56493 RepID=A0A9P6LBP8_9AGAM|nr:hypothetical protein BJ322DRAFT_1026234 [Thelephora terrestris]
MVFIGEDRLLVTDDLGESCMIPVTAITGRLVMAEGAGYGDFSQVIGQDIPFYPVLSRRVLVLIFISRDSMYDEVLGLCVVHSEILLRLVREAEKASLCEMRQYAITPDTDGIPGAIRFLRYSVWGSRFVRVYTNEDEKRAKVSLFDLIHWNPQQPDMGPGGRGARMRRRGLGSLKESWSIWDVWDVAILQDSLVFFSCNGQHDGYRPQAEGTSGVLNLW